jgi:hypothetical protein
MIQADKHCLNCDTPVSDLFCPHCGQETSAEKFDARYMGRKLLDAFDLDKGLLHSLFFLIIKPGTAIRNYISGQRINFTNPIKIFLILGAIATLITISWESSTHEVPRPALGIELYDYQNFYKYAAKYFSFFNLTAIPFFSLFSWLVFFKSNYNYIENLILNIYIGAGQFLILILFKALPIMFYSNAFAFIYGSANFLYNMWALIFFFQAFSTKGFLKSFVAVGIPQAGAYFFSYFVYRIVPPQFWNFLDTLMN